MDERQDPLVPSQHLPQHPSEETVPNKHAVPVHYGGSAARASRVWRGGGCAPAGRLGPFLPGAPSGLRGGGRHVVLLQRRGQGVGVGQVEVLCQIDAHQQLPERVDQDSGRINCTE